MPAAIPDSEMVGRRFGRLVVVRRDRCDRWECACDCGRGYAGAGQPLRAGVVHSCGCLAREVTAARNRKHGLAPRGEQSRTYRIWKGMRTRCNNPRRREYQRYGGRGIRVCDRWDSYELFLADMGEAPSGATLDRVDNDGNYEPGNCRWATYQENARHTRRSRMLTVDGVTAPLAHWCESRGVKYTLIRDRLKLGWSHEDAVKIPAGQRRPQSNPTTSIIEVSR